MVKMLNIRNIYNQLGGFLDGLTSFSQLISFASILISLPNGRVVFKIYALKM